MFTGLVEEVGVVKSAINKGDMVNFAIGAKAVLAGTKKGDSIAVNGVCLTVCDIKRGMFFAQAIKESLARTNLGSLKTSDKVNLERALKLSDRISGHIVSGHADGVCRVKNIKVTKHFKEITFFAPASILKYIVEKGSVALNGVSLTVSKANENSFAVSLIPYTLGSTNLDDIKHSDEINVEVDMFGKYIVDKLGSTHKNIALHGGKNIINTLMDIAENGDMQCN